jgi:CRP/FNR family transcriptional regulator
MTSRHILGPLLDRQISCSECSLKKFCLVRAIEKADMEKLTHFLNPNQLLRRRDHLFRQGTRLENLYVVKSGSLKSYASTEDGLEQVVGFYFSGDIIGLDGLGTRLHHTSAIALETTVVCAIPVTRMEDLWRSLPRLHQEMYRAVGNEIARDEDMFILLAQRSAEERLATFLLSLSHRFHEHGFSGKEFTLSMAHQDIASFLGLTPQTFSRVFTALKNEGVIAATQRRIHINDLEELREAAKLCAPCHLKQTLKVA